MAERKPLHNTEELSQITFLISGVAALVFLYLRFFLFPATPFVAIGDQNLFLNRAIRILHSQVMYRDFFELVGPGTNLLYAAFLRFFGVHTWIMAAWGVVTGFAFAYVITSIARRIFRGLLILLPAFLFLVFDFSNAIDLTHHWYSTLAAMAAVSVLISGTSLVRIGIAGALCGVATLFTQTQGGLVFGALVVYLLWVGSTALKISKFPAQLAALFLPYFVIVVGVLGYYAYQAGTHTVYFDLIVFPLKYLSSGDVNSPRTYLRQLPHVHGPGDIIRIIPFLFIYVLVPYIYLAGFYRLWRQRREMAADTRRHLVLLHLIGIALFLAVASAPRFFRLCTVAPPAILICVWLVSQQHPAQKLIRNGLWCLVSIFALLPLYRQVQWHATLNLPVGRAAFTEREQFQEYQWFAQSTRPGELFFNDPVLLYYLQLQSPASTEFVATDEYSQPEIVAEIVRALQNSPPHYIMLYSEDKKTENVHDHSAPFRQFVHDHYRIARIFPTDHGAHSVEVWEFAQNSGS